MEKERPLVKEALALFDAKGVVPDRGQDVAGRLVTPGYSIRASSRISAVNRNFTATEPNQLWITVITEHNTREGTVYACFLPDETLRKAVGWPVDRRPETSLVNPALFMA